MMARHNKKERRRLAYRAVTRGADVIATEAGVSEGTVKKWLHEFDLLSRPMQQDIALPSLGIGVDAFVAEERTYEQIAADIEPFTAILLAGNPNTPPEVLEAVSLTGLIKVKWALADNPNTPGHVLRQIHEDGHSSVRIAANPNTPTDILEELTENAEDTDIELLSALASNPSLPVGLMRMLVDNTLDDKYKNWSVVCAIACNSGVPHELFMEWAESESWQHNLFLVEGRAVPVEALLVVLSKVRPDDGNMQYEFVRNKHMPAEVLDAIARMTTCEGIRFDIARHVNTAAATLEFLALRNDK